MDVGGPDAAVPESLGAAGLVDHAVGGGCFARGVLEHRPVELVAAHLLAGMEQRAFGAGFHLAISQVQTPSLHGGDHGDCSDHGELASIQVGQAFAQIHQPAAFTVHRQVPGDGGPD